MRPPRRGPIGGQWGPKGGRHGTPGWEGGRWGVDGGPIGINGGPDREALSGERDRWHATITRGQAMAELKISEAGTVQFPMVLHAEEVGWRPLPPSAATLKRGARLDCCSGMSSKERFAASTRG